MSDLDAASGAAVGEIVKEQIKLAANLLNAIAAGLIVVGIVGPTVALMTGQIGNGHDIRGIVLVSIGLALFLHVVAHGLLRRLS